MKISRLSVRIPHSLNTALLVCAALISPTSIYAAIVTTGDTSIGVGTFGNLTTGIMKAGAEFTSNANLDGSLVVNGGSVLISKEAPPTPGVPVTTEPEPGGMIGRGSGSVGTATVTGIDSTWRLEGTGSDPGITFGPYLLVGRDGGRGELNITAGGKVILDGLGTTVGEDASGNIQIGRDNALGSNVGAGGSVLNIVGSGSEARIENIDHSYFVMGKVNDDATVNITNGGALNVGGNNSLTVFRNGTVNINTGGSIETNIINIGDRENTNATMNLDGSTSSIHITGVGDADNGYSNSGFGGFMTIGGRTDSVAVVNVTGGAQINIDDGSGIAHDGTVSGGSGFSLGGNSALGFGGQGTLNVESGSLVTVSGGGEFVGIGRADGGGGIVNVNSGGQVIIENNGDSDGVFMATTSTSGEAVLNVDGATSLFDAGKILYVGVDDTFAGTAKADINLTNGGAVKAGIILVGNQGTITGSGSLTGNVLMNRGSIIPGNSPGTLTIDGDFEMIAGVLEIEVAGLGAGEFDFLNITGSAEVTGGTILLSFIDGFLPTMDDSFSFLTADMGLTVGADVTYDFQGVDESFSLDIASLSGGKGLKFTALNDAVALPSPGAVPVPAAIWLFLSAVGFLGFLQKRKGNSIFSTAEPVAV